MTTEAETEAEPETDETTLKSDDSDSERKHSRVRRTWVLVAAVVFAVLTVVYAATTHFVWTASDDAVARARGVIAERAGALAADALTYSAETIEEDVERVESHAVGEFLESYSALATDTLIPAVQASQVHAAWEVTGTSVISVSAGHGEALVFLRGTSTSADKPDPTYMFSSVRVVVIESDDEWFIEKLEAL